MLIAKPAANDYDEPPYLTKLTVARTGDIFVSHSERTFLQYTAAGERMGLVRTEVDEVSQDWYSQPLSGNRLVLGYRNAYLIDASGTTLRVIERGANGRWLQNPGPASVAPNDSFALISGAPPRFLDDEVAAVTLYSSTGEAMTTWPIPEGAFTFMGLAYDGEHLAFVVPSDDNHREAFVVVTNAEGTPQFRTPTAPAHTIAAVFLVPSDHATELWLLDGEYGIDRYAMP